VTNDQTDVPASPEELLAQVTAQYERYLEVAELADSVIEHDEPDAAAAPPPLGFVLWES
jgi:hypothetical protein